MFHESVWVAALLTELVRGVTKRLRTALLLALVLVVGGCSDEPEQRVDAPPECIEAWRAGHYAPVHCEEYPEAYKAVRDGR